VGGDGGGPVGLDFLLLGGIGDGAGFGQGRGSGDALATPTGIGQFDLLGFG
jgi:hypothetical protein